jgi:uncharacterized protein YndB with AHSA1/START domain
MSTATQEPTTDQALYIVRDFNASRKLVWDAWSKPEMMSKWWGPKRYTAPVVKIDFRVGGKYHNVMRAPDGKEFWSTGTYKEISPMDRIVVTDSFADEEGNVVSSDYYGMHDMPLEMLVTLEFFEIEPNKTRMKLTHVGVPEGKLRDMTASGWNESFDKLAAAVDPDYKLTPAVDFPKVANSDTFKLDLPNDLDIVISREFNAPQQLLWDCWAKPEHVKNWWGLHGSELKICDIDLRVGGAWRYVFAGEEPVHGFNGIFKAIEKPAKLEKTFIYEPMPNFPSLVFVTFEDLGNGRTRMKEITRHETKMGRDGHVQSGMEYGSRQSLDRLEFLLSQQTEA